jgi:acyl-CoA thioesterase-1
MGEPVTILAFGDSLTQGYGLPASDGFVPQLEAWLAERGAEVELINAGVSGDTTAGGVSRIDWALGDGIDGVIVALGGNDLLRGTPIESVEENLDTILGRIDAKGLPALLVGYKATPNYGPEYKEGFDALFPKLAERHDVRLMPYIFRGMAQAVDAGEAERAALFQPDGIHPNARGVKLNVAEIGPYVLELIEDVQARS